MTWFTRQLAVAAEPVCAGRPPVRDPLVQERLRYEQVGRELAAATRELGFALWDENRYRATHATREKIFNRQYQVQVGAMAADLADAEIQTRIRRSRTAREKFTSLLDEHARLKRTLGLGAY